MINRTYEVVRDIEKEIEEQVMIEDYIVYSTPFQRTREEHGLCFWRRFRNGEYTAVYVSQIPSGTHVTLTRSESLITPSYSGVTEKEYEEREFFKPFDPRGAAKRVIEMLHRKSE